MITEGFLNLCSRILSDPNPEFNDTVVSDIFDTLDFFQDKKDNIPLAFQAKYDLTYSICRLRNEGKDIDEALDDIHLTVASDQKSFLDGLLRKETNIPGKKVETSLKQIASRKKLTILLKDLPFIENFIDRFHTSSFDDLDEAIEDYDSVVGKMYARMSEQKRCDSYNTIKSIDMVSDDYAAVLNQMIASYSGKNSITTGFTELDKCMNGGFEPARVYVFGGASGDGKSVLLANFARKAIERRKIETDKKEIYVYITLENLIDESLMRLYCAHTEKTIKDVVQSLEVDKEQVEINMKEWQLDNNAVLIMAYFPPTITSVADLLVFMEDIQDRYKDEANIKAVYIDYLDLLMAGQKFDLHRLEMGQITIDLKVLAVRMSIPVVTVTQLNRGGYDHKENLSLTQMGESIKKVEHSDFVGLIRSVKQPESKGMIYTDSGHMTIYIGKNRSGPKEKTAKLKSRFSMFRLDDCDRTDQMEFKVNKEEDIFPDIGV